MPKNKPTEVDAYAFIKTELKSLGWDTRSPNVHPQGQVWTQNQCLAHPEIKRQLDKKRPESIVKVSETVLWVIEAKSERTAIDEALDEAEHYYTKRLNRSDLFTVKFISGIAGNDADGYIIKNKFLEKGLFRPIILNDREMSGLLSPEIASRIRQADTARLDDVPVDLTFFLAKAQRINEILHSGAVNINDRARVMAALLLSTIEGPLPSLDSKPTVLINDINTRAQNTLASQGKPEFFDYVRISLPTSRDNHLKYKRALVETLSELYGLNIQSAMNSGTDVLGQFYEVFLKYGPWAQKMGIVLTPRHITRFAAEALDIGLQDGVLDPTCGTGGFLVAAFDYVKARANTTQIERFKQNNVFGIDNQPQLACLAIVNMIFRGDGKNNIIEGDCFTKWLVGTSKNGAVRFPVRYVNEKPSTSELNMITKVLMNPSFAVTKDDPKEYKFVQQALDQMVHGALLFSILPVGAMFEGGEEYEWRKNRLLRENTLLAVVTLPPELFYPVGVHTLGIFVKKGVPHSKDQKVLWIRAIHDGHAKLKGKRLPDHREPNDLIENLPIIRAFIHDPSFPVQDILGVRQASAIDFEDPQLELIPEIYLSSAYPTTDDVNDAIEANIRSAAAFLIQSGVAKYAKPAEKESIEAVQIRKDRAKPEEMPIFKRFKVTQLFEPIRGDFHALSKLERGKIPTVSRVAYDNGVVGYYAKPPDAKLYVPPKLTVSTVTGDTFVQLMCFIATDNVLILHPKVKLTRTSLFFIQAMINRERWRCTYGRQLYKEKFSKTEMYLPSDPDGKINEDYMRKTVEGCSYWGILEPHIDAIESASSKEESLENFLKA